MTVEVSKRTGANLIETVDSVKKTIDTLRKTWPEAVHVTFTQDKSKVIRQMLADLQNSVATGVLLQGGTSTGQTVTDNCEVATGLPAPGATLQLGTLQGVSYTVQAFDEDDPLRGITLSAAAIAEIDEDTVPSPDGNKKIVLRAIGFRRGMVQAVFVIESSFIALTSIVVGTLLGLLLAWNIIRDTRSQPSWENLELVVPWLNLGVIFLVAAEGLLVTSSVARTAAVAA